MRIRAVAVIAVFPAAMAVAQPADRELRTGGLVVSDTTLDALFLCRDSNGDGDALDPGEINVFFDGSNASGLAAPTTNTLSIFQARDRRVFTADGGSDAVYVLHDMNGDGDALDAGEAKVWFSDAGNAAGFRLPTPNGLWMAADGAVYITNAGTGMIPSDAIYRTIDLNGDGDAEDTDEATLWFDLQSLVADSTPFDICFIGDTAYFVDLRGGGTDVIFAARDADGSGAIEAGEFSVFFDDLFGGAPLGFSVDTDGTSLYIADRTGTGTPVLIHRLTDDDASGAIDDTGEVQQVWSTDLIAPPPPGVGNSFDFALAPQSGFAVCSNGAATDDNVFLARDLDSDGGYAGASESTTLVTGGADASGFASNARSVFAVRPPPCPGDYNDDNVRNTADFFEFFADFFASPPDADYNRDGATDTADFFEFFTDFFGPPCV